MKRNARGALAPCLLDEAGLQRRNLCRRHHVRHDAIALGIELRLCAIERICLRGTHGL
jgi:hypothetical protein